MQYHENIIQLKCRRHDQKRVMTKLCNSSLFLLSSVSVVKFLAVLLGDDLEPVGCHVVHSDNTTASSVPEGCTVDGASAKVIGFFVFQVISKG